MLKMRAFSVSEITKYIKKLIGADPILNQLLIEGEISNFTLHSSGHAYFSIKDDDSKMSCMMFSQYVQMLERIPKNGDKVRIHGSISIYERDGRYQLYAQKIEFAGLGELHVRFEALKKKLESEGLFDESHKKEIPKYPQTIGIITSPTGAAIQDIISVATRRSNLSSILLYPVRVQGEYAAGEIVMGIDFFNSKRPVDLLILSRGGGSIEELWAFNEEVVARAIHGSKIPVISGVGHETDFTISDFVSDFRAPTPSAAAEIAIKSKDELALLLEQQMLRIQKQMMSQLERYKYQLESASPLKLKDKLTHRIKIAQNEIERDKNRLVASVSRKVETSRLILEASGDKINSLSPLATMQRGYSIVKQNGKVVKSVEGLAKGDALTVAVSDGSVETTVQKVVKD